MKPADIVLVRGHAGLRHLVDDAIKLGEVIEDGADFEKAYTHVALFIGNGKVAEAQYGRLAGSADLSFYAGDYDIGEVSDLSDDERQKVVDEALKEFGTPYDLLYDVEIGLHILFDLRLPVEDHHKRICTTFVKRVFKNAINLDFNCGDTPEELSKSSCIVVKYV